MKLISFIVPCYNSSHYMEKCINSLLIGGKEIEVIIVNDGSKDTTGEIANRYAKFYPNIIKVIHQQNGGHGEAINTGLKNAMGVYFKVVDSDDWVDEEAYKEIIKQIKQIIKNNEDVDMLISNYVYEKVGFKKKKVIQYKRNLPQDCIFTWESVKKFKKGQYILMHSVIYRTDLLKNFGLKLPKHTFYVDNLFVYEPLPYVKNMYYLNVNFYRYFIGRNDQSINENVMIQRIDQQLKVNRIMIDYFNENRELIENNKALLNYMKHYLEIITTVSSILLVRSKQEENINKKEKLWNYIKEENVNLYKELRIGVFGILLHLPGKYGRIIMEVITG